MRRVLIVPAAGGSALLRPDLPKPLTPVAGSPMIDHVIRRHAPFVQGVVLVIAPATRALFEPRLASYGLPVILAEQWAPTGMLDAILAAGDAATSLTPDRVWISWCDQVLISAATATKLAEVTTAHPGCAAAVPVTRQPDPYVHFDRDSSGRLVAVRQRREGDAMPSEGIADAGLFDLSAEVFRLDLPAYALGAPPGARTGERNFLPFLPWLARGRDVRTFNIPPRESRGINTPEDLASVERWLTSGTGSSS